VVLDFCEEHLVLGSSKEFKIVSVQVLIPHKKN
jgi:hypothetical protein